MKQVFSITRFDAEEFQQLTARPCVYIFRLVDGTVLYVGASRHGLSRPGSNGHPARGYSDLAKPASLEIRWVKDNNAAFVLERKLRKKLRPLTSDVEKYTEHIGVKERTIIDGKEYPKLPDAYTAERLKKMSSSELRRILRIFSASQVTSRLMSSAQAGERKGGTSLRQ